MTTGDENQVPADDDVQSDPSGRDTWAEEGGATTQGPATDADADSEDEHD